MRAWPNGNEASAFQADDAGSIPAARSNYRMRKMNRAAQAFIEGTILGAILASLSIALWMALK
jgi:hypothetical protein